MPPRAREMSGEALYERYKDALRRGHVAALRGRLEEALDAYAEAAVIAPDRPAPHSSAGAALLRARRPAEALRCYDAALQLAPLETALAGRAQALADLGRRLEAAEAYDGLAATRARDARPADAVDAARRALELAEGRERRRTLERLIAGLRASEPDQPGRLALERALLVLEGAAVAGSGSVTDARDDVAATSGGTGDVPALVGDGEPARDGAAGRSRSVLDRDVSSGMDPAELEAAAESAIASGDHDGAVERLLDLAALNRAAGRPAAAMDACYAALFIDQAHVGLHLALVELYDEHGWTALASEKLDLLDRLVELGDDDTAVARVVEARAGRA